MKYSPEGGDIRVTISRAPQEGWVHLKISDQGLGIAKEYQEKVWEPLYRQDYPAFSGIEGSGLGLSIVRHIVESHGGDLSLESSLGQGSTFVVTLPVASDDDSERGSA